MQPRNLSLGSALAPLLLANLSTALFAQDPRPVAPIPSSSDVKTPRETSRMSGERMTRPAAPPASTDIAKDEPRPPSLEQRQAVDHTVMHYDAPGDGSLWARGAHYKASFDASGTTYYPLFGKGEERHHPLALTPASVTLGGEPLEYERAASAVQNGDRIEIDRGSFVEVYQLAPDSIEQMFVIGALPAHGDLVLTLPMESDPSAGLAGALETAETRDHLEFRSEHGHVTYGRAVAIDAGGRRASAATELSGNAITIRVDAEFLASAAMPLVIDPVVATVPIDTSSFENFFPDVAYDATTQRWLVVFEEQAAAGDNDVYYDVCNASGVPMWGGYVNLNIASWNDVKCANLRSATQFLAVSSVSGKGSREIRGRTIEADVSAMSTEFFISGGESGGGPMFNPSVGGDPYPTAPAWYCVAYEREYDDFEDYDILVRLVGPDTSVGAVNYLSNSGSTIDQFPSVGKSNGGSTWMISWERHELDLDESHIWGGRVRYDGVTVNGPFQITAFNDDIYSSASSPLVGSQRTMVCYQRNFGTDWDIVCSVLDGATVVQETNLSTLEGSTFGNDQRQPSVDTDGQHFLVAYFELYSGSDWDVYCSDLRLVGNTIGLAQGRMPLALTTNFEGIVRLASEYGSGGPNRRFLVAWQKTLSADNADILAALVDTVEGGTVSGFCLGDGSGTACPCGLNGGAGRGCPNSAYPDGAQLTLAGTPSTWNDTAILAAYGIPGNSLCIFLQSSTIVGGTPFGDGVGCIGAGMIRLASKNATMGQVGYPYGEPNTLHNRGQVPLDGGTRAYQVWYRNTPAYCTSAAFNITSGVIVNWAR